MLLKPEQLGANKALILQSIAATKKKQEAKATLKGGNTLMGKIKNMISLVNSKLGHYADKLICIRDIDELHAYITKAIEKGAISIDTETTGLDPITDQIVGACIYTYGEKPAYVPINHVSYMTKVKLPNQLTEEQVANEFKRLMDANTKVIMFNAKFDIRVIRHQLGLYMTAAHCGFIAAKCLKNDEEEANLKALWVKYCAEDKNEPTLTFGKMFDKINFSYVPIDTATLYAAKDALMTLELYDFQMQFLDENNPKCIACDFQRVAKLYREIELPIINITADIEDRGVVIDKEYAASLEGEYQAELDKISARFYKELENYKQQLNDYLAKNPKSKIETPFNIASPDQLAELFYDCLGLPMVNRKKPRSTDKETLKELNHPLGNIVIDYKAVAILLQTFIKKLPTVVNKKTNRLHCNFNQYGTDTGRYSSNNPNLQNIPSHDKSVRKMFTATEEVNIESQDDTFSLLIEDEVKTLTGYKLSQELAVGDTLMCDDGNYTVKAVSREDKKILVTI